MKRLQVTEEAQQGYEGGNGQDPPIKAGSGEPLTKRRRLITKDKDQKVRPNLDNDNPSNPSATLSKMSSSEGIDEASENSTSTIKLPPDVSRLRKSTRMVAGMRLTPSKSPHLFDDPDKSEPQGQIKDGSDDVPQEDEPEQKGNNVENDPDDESLLSG